MTEQKQNKCTIAATNVMLFLIVAACLWIIKDLSKPVDNAVECEFKIPSVEIN